ncbi:MAG: heme ABC exporter ATP-binding protein CcmA [Anaerolineae bacterium]|nr:heme ABC exporter ATP-binding protein CcmA [Anaerolineae bacterium]
MAESRPVIEIENITKIYGYLPVLKQFNLTVEKGQFVALLGPNGSGKSTLLRLLSGLSKPTSGVIRIGGWEIPREAQAVRAQIGMVSHKPLLYDNLTARENLEFFGSLYNMRDAARIDSLLEQVGLSKRADSLVRTFSRGMQQRLSIARSLLQNPAVLLFDEPYTGLDQDAAQVLDDLLRAAQASGQTIVMVTHQLERAALLAERIIILSRGKVAHDSTHKIEPLELAAIYTQATGAATSR